MRRTLPRRAEPNRLSRILRVDCKLESFTPSWWSPRFPNHPRVSAFGAGQEQKTQSFPLPTVSRV